MKALRRFAKRLSASLLGRQDDDRAREELAEHLTLLTEEYVRAGTALDEARRRARRKPGAHGMMTDAGQDTRYAARMLRKQPAFTIAAVLTLALGIGAYTAIFSIVNSIVLKPLPYPSPGELVSLQHTAPGAAGMGNLASNLRLSASMYFTYAEQTRTFRRIGVWAAGTSTVTGGGDPEEVRSIFVSDGVLEALAVPPLLGRSLGAADQKPSAPTRTVVLGYGFWMRRFGGDASVIGRTIIVNSNSSEVVGGMPKDFRIVTAEPDLIVPFA